MTPRETILAALHARLSALTTPVLGCEVLPERVPAEGLLILRDGEPGEPEVTLSPLQPLRSEPMQAVVDRSAMRHHDPFGGSRAPRSRGVEAPVGNADRDFPKWSEHALQRAVDAAGIALWSWNVDTDRFDMDERGFELWDVSSHESLTFEHLSEKIHPADRDRVRAAFFATRAVVGPYEIDFRTLIGKRVRWISARGRGSDEDIVNRAMMGVFLDVTGRKQAEESSELLAGEMSHRVKNLLAIASGLARITSRTSLTVDDMASQLMHRLTALGRAHDLVRPLPGNHGDAALLGDIFTVLLAPYDDKGAFAGRIRIAVPRMGVGEAAAASLALVVHELATNSLKYGSLSSDEGVLDVSGCVVGDNVRIIWTEQGGPEVSMPAGQHGYGSKLVGRSVEESLCGSISYDWSKSGALVTMEINGELLAS